MVFISLVLQICMKGSIDRLANLYLTVQIMCYVTIFQFKIPVFALMILTEFKKLVEFDML